MTIRRWILAGTAGTIAAALATGFALSGRLISPQQAAAAAAPPPPGPVTAQVEQRSLVASVVARGRLASAGGIAVRPSTALTGPDSVVTRIGVTAGQPMTDATYIADVSGEPVFAASLPFPLYRDLVEGDTGPDVAAYTGVLNRAGLLFGAHNRIDAAVLRGTAIMLQRANYPAQLLTGPSAPTLSAGSTVTATATIRRRWLVDIPPGMRRVLSLTMHVGTVITEPTAALLTLTSGPATVVALLDVARRGAFLPGATATVTDDTSGFMTKATVRSVGRAPIADPASGETGLPVVLLLDQREDSARLTAPDLRVTISSTSAARQPASLIVPTAGIFTDLTGRSTVQLQTSRGPADVDVTVGQCVSGWCPVRGGGLHRGQRIILDQGIR